jgi:hypothetical protein
VEAVSHAYQVIITLSVKPLLETKFILTGARIADKAYG